MRIPNHIRAVAAEAFTEGTPWPAFLVQHRDTIKQAEPYDRGRFHRLVEMVRHVVLTGTSSGQFGVSDIDDSRAEWFSDDVPAAGIEL